ncbi:hypothetical protein D3C80_381420 [compost metagenome]
MKRLFILGVIICAALKSIAQNNAPILNYSYNEAVVNPAFMGTYTGFTAGIIARKQAMGIDGAPVAQRLQIGQPLYDTKSAIGFLITNNTYGVSSKVDLMGQYSYSLPLSKGKLLFGLQTGVESLKENNDELSLKDQELGALFANTGRAYGFNVGFGAYYATDKYYVGLSAPQFFYNYFDGDAVKSQLFDANMFRTYLVAGYDFELTNIKVRPSALLCYQTSSAVNAEAALTGYFFEDNFWTGLAYRTSKEVGFNVGLRVEKMISFNYSFGAGVGQLQQKAGTTHEIGIRMALQHKKSQ